MDWKQIITEILASGVSQTELGERIGRSQAWVSEAAKGKYNDLSWKDGQAILAIQEELKKAA